MFKECLSGLEDENKIEIDSIQGQACFNQEKLNENREEITNFLMNLPEQFMRSKGGGWSLINGCFDNNGKQWTGFQETVEQLFLLGIGINKVQYCMPKMLWDAMPGGVPYYQVLDEGNKGIKTLEELAEDHKKRVK